jgi:putative membrane protein
LPSSTIGLCLAVRKFEGLNAVNAGWQSATRETYALGGDNSRNFQEFAMTRVVNTLFAFSLGTLLAVVPAMAQSSKDSTMSKSSAATTMTDTMFMKKAARANLAEVELGRLAVQKATNADVKKFGQRMIDDHTKADDQLKKVAADEHVTLPETMSASDKATKESLEKLSGEEFDHAYMSDMVKDHKKDVAEFKTESKTAHDETVKNFAAQTLPTLEDHLKEAEKIAPAQKMARSS